MTKKKTFILGVIAVALVAVLGLYFAFTGSPQPIAQTRTVRLEISPDYENYLSDFAEKTLTENENSVSFHGVMPYKEEVLETFDNVGLADGIVEEESNIVYDCALDMENLRFLFTATLLDENGNVLEIEQQYTDAFVTENGGLDAYVEIGDETYLLSEYADKETLDNCFFGWLFKAIVAVVVVVVVFIVVAETAEQIKARSNYKYNQNLESRGMGVDKNVYITDQSDKITKGHKPANYKFGFTTFGSVGCEVASAYNSLIGLGKPEMLSETIKSFETLSIEYAVGFGHLGSEPSKIYRFLNKRGVSYNKYGSYSSFKNAVNNKNSCHIIMSRWNNPKTSGLHTFYLNKTSKSNFDSYNWTYNRNVVPKSTLDQFNNGSGFIVGYIVW